MYDYERIHTEGGRDQIFTSRRGGAEAYTRKRVGISDGYLLRGALKLKVQRCSTHVMGTDLRPSPGLHKKFHRGGQQTVIPSNYF
jgi:hypothetical protein